MQQGAVIILIFLWILAFIVILTVLKGYEDSDNANAVTANAYSLHSNQLPQPYMSCLSE